MTPGRGAPGLLAFLTALGLGAGCRCGAEGRRATPQGGTPPAEPARPAAPSPEARASGPAPRTDASPPEPRAMGAPPPSDADAAAAPARPGQGVPPTLAEEAPPTPGARLPLGIRLRGGLLDLDVYRRDARALLRDLATVTGTNLVLFEGVKGDVTVQLRDLPRARAVAKVARALGLRVEEQGALVLVRP